MRTEEEEEEEEEEKTFTRNTKKPMKLSVEILLEIIRRKMTERMNTC